MAASPSSRTSTRTRAIERKLRTVQELPADQAAMLLPLADIEPEDRRGVPGDG